MGTPATREHRSSKSKHSSPKPLTTFTYRSFKVIASRQGGVDGGGMMAAKLHKVEYVKTFPVKCGINTTV